MNATETICECANCTKTWPQSALKDIKRYHERVDEEDEVRPDGECPDCGSLAYSVTGEVWKPDPARAHPSTKEEFFVWVADFMFSLSINADDVLVAIGPKGRFAMPVGMIVAHVVNCDPHVRDTFKAKAIEIKTRELVVGLLGEIAVAVTYPTK